MSNVYIRDLDTNEIVKTIPVTTTSPAMYEKFKRGILMRMDLDKYYLDDREIEGVS